MRRLFVAISLTLIAFAPGICPASDTLATVDGKPITEADLAGKGGGGKLLKSQMQCYEAKKEATDEFLFDHLVGEEAKKTGTTSDKVIENEVTKKIKKVTDADIRKFYDEFKKRGGQNPPPFEQVSGRIREKLEQDGQRERQDAYFAELKKKYKVAYAFTRPTANVATGSYPPKGADKAPVTIVEFSDFQCPFCKRANDTIDEVIAKYRGKVKIYFRDYPLPFHQRAMPAAMAARCAHDQGKFWAYYDKLFDKQQLSDEDFSRYAKELSMDKGKFDECIKSGKHKADVEADAKAGQDAGVNGTPAFFINGIPLSGAVPFSEFKSIIDEQLTMKGVTAQREVKQVMP